MDILSPEYLKQAFVAGSIGSFFLVYLAGVVTSLTPCIYPMIPITVGILGANQAESKSRAFLLTLAYVFGISLTYAGLGLISAFTGSLFGSFSSNPWLLISIAIFIELLGLNMLDVFQIRIPMLNISRAGKKAGIFSNMGYGMIFGLVMSPCTAPVLAAILAWVAQSHSVIMGPLLLFFYSLGMGTLLLAIGTFASLTSKLPKSGNWMIYVKKAMGWLMLATAAYFFFKAGFNW